MVQSGELDALLNDERLNAGLAWALVAFVSLVGVESLLDADWVWLVFTAIVVSLAVVPPVAFRDPKVMLPSEVLLLAALPLLVRGLYTAGLLADLATYVSVAALALILAVELDVFTPVLMPTWFAVFFVVIATMATAGVWAVLQWLSDVYLGTAFIYPTPPPVPESIDQAALETLMWDFVVATLAGILAGIVFAFYFRERDTRIRLPEEIEAAIESKEDVRSTDTVIEETSDDHR